MPTAHAFGGENAPRLERYEPARAYAFSNSAQADRAAVLRQEAIEARNKTWLGRSTVRTLGAGHRFTLTEGSVDGIDAACDAAEPRPPDPPEPEWKDAYIRRVSVAYPRAKVGATFFSVEPGPLTPPAFERATFVARGEAADAALVRIA